MERPGDRCEYVQEEADYYKPYCCSREAWREGRCAWHAPVSGKPSEFLQQARITVDWGFPPDTRDRWIGSRGERLDGARLREADLRNVSLSDCTLFGADMEGAHLQGGDLSNADLRDATLRGVEGAQCELQNAVLEKADLTDADLRGANLSNASLRKADLTGANLRDADLTGADLRKADLSEANLQGADLPGSRLYGADLSSAELIDADCSSASFRDATLTDAYLMDADLAAATFETADLPGADLEGANLSSAVLRQANFRGASLEDADLVDVDARGAEFGNAMLERARFDHATLYGASLVDARIYGTTFGNAVVSEATELGEYVPYDPTRDADGSGETAADGGENASPVDRATKAAGSYRALAGLARENEFSDLRSRFYLRRKDVERHHHRDRGRRYRWLRSVLADRVTRYGESAERVVATSALVVVLFGAIYPLGLLRSADGGVVRYAAEPTAALQAFSTGLYYSARTFATAPTEYRAIGAGRALAAAESLLGLLLVALLVFVFARRATR